jgi:molybdenum cofactor cytidylyltransferase
MGKNKLLLKINKEFIIEHILKKLAGFETIVVTGHFSEEISDIVNRYEAKTVYNPKYENGMSTSFQAGLENSPEDIDAAFIVLGDTFGFKKILLDEMIMKMKSTNALLVSPVYEDKRGHPVLVHKTVFQEFLNLKENQTMKDVILRYDEDHIYIDGDIWTIIDLDTPEDYEYVKKLWKNTANS